MIEEKINFKPNFPIDISINSIIEYPKHWQNSLEIICILDGSIRIQDSCFSCCLTEGDIYIFDCEELHSIYPISKTNIVLSLHINVDYYSKLFKNFDKMTFMCDSYIRKNELKKELNYFRYLLSKILLELNTNNHSYTENIEYDMKSLIAFIIDNFQYVHYEMNSTNHHVDLKCEKKYHMGKEQMERIHRICDYIYEHHSEDILLSDIAKLEYLNTNYLSRHIKDLCGLNFQELLSLTRAECAEKLLIDTNLKMDIIASKTGFSSRKYLNYHFKKWYKCTPSEYRKNNKNKTKNNRKFLPYDKEKAYKKIQEYLYGNNKLDLFVSSQSMNEENFAKLFFLSAELHQLLITNTKITSHNELLTLLKTNPSAIAVDYSTFLKKIMALLEYKDKNISE